MMDGVEGHIQPADLVMEQVPDEVLEVKKQEVAYHPGYQLQQGWSLVRQVHGWPPCPLGHWCRQHQKHMVVQGDACTVQQRGGCRTTAGLDFKLLDPSPPFPHDVANKEGKAQEEVGGHSQNNGEERRSQIVSVVVPQAVPQRLQQRVIPQTSHPKSYAGVCKIHPEVKITR